MAILNFQKPDKIVLQKANDFEAQFEFRPLEPGYGVTIGNALRRVLLSSLEGFAIVGIRIEGAEHEFATIKGVTEDLTDIILNLKQVRFKKVVDTEVSNEKVVLHIKGKSEFNAGLVLRRRITITGSTLRPRPVAFKAAIAQALRKNVWPLIEGGKMPLNVVAVNGGVSPRRTCTQKSPGSRTL